jgi:signal peptidase I
VDLTPRGVDSPAEPSPGDDRTEPTPAFDDTDENPVVPPPQSSVGEDLVAGGKKRRHRKPRSAGRQALEWILLIGSALAIALLIKAYLFQAFYIPSDSMLPTLQKDDRVLVNKLSYKMHDVHRQDIVVFEAPTDENGNSVAQDGIKDLVKRVIGLPGDHLEIFDGKVHVNGDTLDEGYLPATTITDGGPCNGTTEITVPANSIFVMGDNRNASNDSRCFGPIPEDDIVGRVFVRIWPLSRVGFL